ncbi:MAG: hypothetical protein K2X27_26200 [Candidatus Obscuribacterales bacterium]|nr:hypothetical protein [Candidatus Obscuribacterales bacterium]
MNTNKLTSSSRPDSLGITVYQAGDAVVHETRQLKLAAGKNQVHLEGLPGQFVDDSFEVLETSGPGQFKLGADCFAPADLSTAELLAKALGGKVTFIEQTQQGVLRHTGKLLYVLGNQVVLETAEGVQVLPLTQKFELPELPKGLSATPSLTLEPTVSAEGSYTLKSMYETGGLSWSARYSLYYDEKTGKTGLRCRVKLSNQTGANFEDATFKLLAGYNSSRSRSNSARGGARAASVGLEAAAFSAPMADAPQVETLGEVKLYVLPEPLSLRHNQTKRPYLIVAKDVPVQSELFLPSYYGYQNYDAQPGEDAQKLPVYVRLRMRNDEKSNLGMALPAGEVAVFQPDSSGTFQKTDPSLSLQAVASGEAFKLELRTPSADVKATRVLRDFHEDPEVSEPEVKPVPEGGFDYHTQGGPGVGTPELHAHLRSEVLETAEVEEDDADAEESGKKKVKPRFRTEQREVTVYNFKNKPVQVIVHEPLPGTKFELLSSSQAFAERSNDQGSFKLEVPAGGKASVSYGLKWRIN